MSTVKDADPASQAAVYAPLYPQIKDPIVQGLQRGEWKPGEMIPSELELAARFQVSQGTVRKAVDELSTENLLVRRQGKGTRRHASRTSCALSIPVVVPDEHEPTPCHEQRSSIGSALVQQAEIARHLAVRPSDPLCTPRRLLSFEGTLVDRMKMASRQSRPEADGRAACRVHRTAVRPV